MKDPQDCPFCGDYKNQHTMDVRASSELAWAWVSCGCCHQTYNREYRFTRHLDIGLQPLFATKLQPSQLKQICEGDVNP